MTVDELRAAIQRLEYLDRVQRSERGPGWEEYYPEEPPAVRQVVDALAPIRARLYSELRAAILQEYRPGKEGVEKMPDPKVPYDVLLALAEAADAMDRDYPGEQTIGVERALAAYRAAKSPPLRTRAEVDAELSDAARDLGALYTRAKHERIDRLCREPIAPDSDPDDGTCAHVWSVPGPGKVPECLYCFTPKDSGTSSASAAKESHAGAHAGAAHDEGPCGCEESVALRARISDLERRVQLAEDNIRFRP